jgi:hypothetical protein
MINLLLFISAFPRLIYVAAEDKMFVRYAL